MKNLYLKNAPSYFHNQTNGEPIAFGHDYLARASGELKHPKRVCKIFWTWHVCIFLEKTIYQILSLKM